MHTDTLTLDFLHEYAQDKTRALSREERATTATAYQLLHEADEIVIYLGGKAGRLGECVVGTGLLESTLQALQALNKAGTPIKILVDEGASALFEERLYQERYWPHITIAPLSPTQDFRRIYIQETSGQSVLVLDFHGANDGMPYIHTETIQPATAGAQPRRISTLGQLFRVGLRSYARRGPLRRYADFIEDLFSLPEGSVDGPQAQPRIYLSSDEDARYTQLASQLALDPEALLVICFFQSVVPAKCYERWDEVLHLLCSYVAEHFPQQKITFLLPCGPDTQLPEGIRQPDMEEWLHDFTGVNNNAQIIITATPSLRDLAILTSRATLALSNDTGPGHIAGALGIPTITTFLPGTIYSRPVWSSTPYHHGVSLEPNPFSYHELEAAVIWGRTHVINTIAPDDIQQAAISYLAPRLQSIQKE